MDWILLSTANWSLDPPLRTILNRFFGWTPWEGVISIYNTLETRAISAFTIPKNNSTIGSHPVVSRFMKGIYKSNPPTPRYKTTWDVQQVLSYLSSFPPIWSSFIPLRLLCMLVALVTAQRGQSLHMLDVGFMTEFADGLEFVLPEHVKQSRPGISTTINHLESLPCRPTPLCF